MLANIEFAPADFVTLPLAAFGLAMGVQLAYNGRLAKGRWARIVEAVVIAVLTSIVANIAAYLLVTRPAIYPLIGALVGAAIGVLAYIVSGRYQRDFYGLVGALIASAIAFSVVLFLPGFQLLGLGGLAIVLIAAIGFRMGTMLRDSVLILGTAIGGAQWIATSVVGLIQAALDDSAGYLRDRALDFVAPIISLLVSLIKAVTSTTEQYLLIVSIVTLALVAASGIAMQWRRRSEVATLPRSFREWIIDPLLGKAWYAAGIAVVYALVFVYVRGTLLAEAELPVLLP